MKRHPLDILSLLLGIVFLIVAIAYLAGDLTGAIPSLQIAMPLMLVGLGFAGVVGAIAAQQRTDDTVAPAPHVPLPDVTSPVAGTGTAAPAATGAIESRDPSGQDTIILGSQDPQPGGQRSPHE